MNYFKVHAITDDSRCENEAEKHKHPKNGCGDRFTNQLQGCSKKSTEQKTQTHVMVAFPLQSLSNTDSCATVAPTVTSSDTETNKTPVPWAKTGAKSLTGVTETLTLTSVVKNGRAPSDARTITTTSGRPREHARVPVLAIQKHQTQNHIQWNRR